jgi:DNA-binding phage protein
MLARMSARVTAQVVNHLPGLLRRRAMSWGELARRSLLPAGLLIRLRTPDANPRLAVAERVAAALGMRVEDLWRLPPRRRRPR